MGGKIPFTVSFRQMEEVDDYGTWKGTWGWHGVLVAGKRDFS